jgi:hypothetical protein
MERKRKRKNLLQIKERGGDGNELLERERR